MYGRYQSFLSSLNPDKPPSQTTSYRPISLLSTIVKLFERVIEKRLRKYLEDNGFLVSISQALGNPSQPTIIFFIFLRIIMESFNRAEHVIAAFLEVEKAFIMFGTMDAGTKFTSMICPPSFVGGPLIS